MSHCKYCNSYLEYFDEYKIDSRITIEVDVCRLCGRDHDINVFYTRR
ncbi:MAG: hypothetical protein ACTSQY_00860 [Candidatus Odinarchaeia archaeon]